MRVQFLADDPQSDPLISDTIIPERLNGYLFTNCEPSFHYTKNFEYLEQRYVSDDCIMCWLDIKAYTSCNAYPVSDQPMMAIVYIFEGEVPAFLQGFEPLVLIPGFAYLFYVPGEAMHRIQLENKSYRVMYCAISESYLANLAKENAGIKELVERFKKGSPEGIIEKLSPIKSFALYQMWLVQQCNEIEAFQQSHLKARCVDLVLDYIKQSQSYAGEKHVFNQEIIDRNEKAFEAKQIIDEHDNGKIKIKSLARTVGLSPQQLTKIFKQVIKQPIGEYQLEKRFDRACKMLRETNMYLCDIAMKIGYQDESSLTRLFQRKLKITPQEYRARFKK